MMKISEKELFKAGVHFGHKTSTWHPKMKNFIYGQKNGVHVFDLTKTKEAIESAQDLVKKVVAQDKKILFVGTKIQAKKIFEKKAVMNDMPFVTERWLGGTLTNFKVIGEKIKKLKELKKMEQTDDYEKKYNKRERLRFSQEIQKLEKVIGGIQDMRELPGAIFISSARYEKTPLREARLENIPTIAICDSNANPEKVDCPVPANDDSLKSIELIASAISEAIIYGKKELNKK